MQSQLVYVVPKWTEICARDFKEGSEQLCEVIIEGETKIYNFDAFTDETYHRLYDRQPNRLADSDIKPENKIWIAIHQQMTELESFQQFSNRLNGDEFLAGIGDMDIFSFASQEKVHEIVMRVYRYDLKPNDDIIELIFGFKRLIFS